MRRVASSSTFEKSPRLRAFFLHVCRCALDNKPEAATEQQIGIYVYDRPPGYNPNEDNIVRSQARLLRMKLEHHFANEGKDEADRHHHPERQVSTRLRDSFRRAGAPACSPARAGQASPFAADPGRSGRAVRTRDCLARLPAVFKSRSADSTGLRRSRGFGSPPGTERAGVRHPGANRSRWPPAPAKSVSLPVIQGLLTWTWGGAVGKPTVTTKEAFPSPVRGISSPL